MTLIERLYAEVVIPGLAEGGFEDNKENRHAFLTGVADILMERSDSDHDVRMLLFVVNRERARLVHPSNGEGTDVRE